jgi:ribosomal RNA assembly protein
MFVKIPKERVAVIIGRNGYVKKQIQKRLSVKLRIDSQTGNVLIDLAKEAKDPSHLFKAKDVVLAVGRGFSPSRAFMLLDNTDSVLEIIDLRNIFGKSLSDSKRIKGRIIGRKGKTRQTIEECSEAFISIYGHTIAILGGIQEVEIAREAIKLLIQGKQHKTVYRFLQKRRYELKKKSLLLWEQNKANKI